MVGIRWRIEIVERKSGERNGATEAEEEEEEEEREKNSSKTTSSATFPQERGKGSFHLSERPFLANVLIETRNEMREAVLQTVR